MKRSVHLLIAATFVTVSGLACRAILTQQTYVDFVSFWAAGRLASSSAYDIATHRMVEMTATDVRGLMPFAYPPPFLLILTPLGRLTYPAAFIVWVVGTGALYTLVARRMEPLSNPCVLSNALVGQTGFLTSAVFVGGTSLLGTKPFWAGIILGCLVIKPQLAILIPLAFIAAGNWRAFAGAATSSLFLLGVALVAFDAGTYRAFFGVITKYPEYIQTGGWPWAKLASPYAFARYFGLNSTVSLALHWSVAAAAAWVVWGAWRRAHAHKVPILAATTLLVPPYIMTYDGLFLVVPLAALTGIPALLIWTLALLPLLGDFGFYSGPNTISLAAGLSLVILMIDNEGQAIGHKRTPRIIKAVRLIKGLRPVAATLGR